MPGQGPPDAGPGRHAAAPAEVRVIREDTVLHGDLSGVRLVIAASHVTIDGNGATLLGPGEPGRPDSYKGVAISAAGCSDVRVRNLKAAGWAAGLSAEDGVGWLIEGCDFSDNFHDPDFDWGDGPRQGGILLTRISGSTIRHNRANRVWYGLDLDTCHDNHISRNDFSRCSNVCLRLRTSCRNHIAENDLSHGIRIRPGEVHARDSAGVLVESGSDHNRFAGNDVRYGGDGVFIRVLNHWVSRGNLFIENDCSYANNNCFEAWSPGNTYLRNKANHGSYGFWLGASDQTVLIGNEAAYNGLPDGNHNAPEPDFGHGGIVFVNGPSSHARVLGNHCHHNNGGGIVLRGDRASEGRKWKAFHWILQDNRLDHNRWGIFARFADWLHVAGNRSENNAEPDVFDAVTNLFVAARPPGGTEPGPPPRAVLRGPTLTAPGQPVRFDAAGSATSHRQRLTFRWDLGDGTVRTEPTFLHAFARPGYYRVGLTVSDGVLADLAWRDVVVAHPVTEAFGTEGDATGWSLLTEGGAAASGVAEADFADDTDSVVGRVSLRFSARPEAGQAVTAIYPATRDAGWDLSDRTRLSFWVRAENAATTGFDGPGPVVRLHAPGGRITFTPVGGQNVFKDGGYSEARWTWLPVEIPLDGGDGWERTDAGSVSLGDISALSFTFATSEPAPFTVWLDGISSG